MKLVYKIDFYIEKKKKFRVILHLTTMAPEDLDFTAAGYFDSDVLNTYGKRDSELKQN